MNLPWYAKEKNVKMKCSLEAHEEFKEAHSTLEAQKAKPMEMEPKET